MVEQAALDLIFHALADSTRRRILQEVAKGSPTVGELGEPFDISGPAISKHLKVLEKAQLITRVKEGKVSRFRLNPELFSEASEVMREIAGFWLERSDHLSEAKAEESESAVVDDWQSQDDEMWKY